MSHYFEYDPTLDEEKRIIEFPLNDKKIMVVSDKGTFSKYRVDLGTRIFINTLISSDLYGSCLDLGSGNGIIGICLKVTFPSIEISFSDINPKCCQLTEESLKLNEIEGKVYLSDGFNNIQQKFDNIFLNSPISCGKEVCFKLYRECYSNLNENGRLFIVINKDKGALSHKKELESIFKEVSILEKKKGYFILQCKD